MDRARGKRADCNQWVIKNRRSTNILVSISSRPAVTVTLVLCQADTQCGEGRLQPRWNLVAPHRMPY